MRVEVRKAEHSHPEVALVGGQGGLVRIELPVVRKEEEPKELGTSLDSTLLEYQ